MNNVIKAASVAGLLVAWSAADASITYDLEIQINSDIENAMVIQDFTSFATFLMTPEMASISAPGEVISGILPEQVLIEGAYTLAATYSGGVVVGFNEATTLQIANNNETWDSLFASFSEDAIAAALTSISTGAGDVGAAESLVSDWFRSHTSYWSLAIDDATLFKFSVPVGDGQVSWNVVPEPGTMLALGVGVAAFARRRRK